MTAADQGRQAKRGVETRCTSFFFPLSPGIWGGSGDLAVLDAFLDLRPTTLVHASPDSGGGGFALGALLLAWGGRGGACACLLLPPFLDTPVGTEARGMVSGWRPINLRTSSRRASILLSTTASTRSASESSEALLAASVVRLPGRGDDLVILSRIGGESSSCRYNDGKDAPFRGGRPQTRNRRQGRSRLSPRLGGPNILPKSGHLGLQVRQLLTESFVLFLGPLGVPSVSRTSGPDDLRHSNFYRARGLVEQVLKRAAQVPGAIRHSFHRTGVF